MKKWTAIAVTGAIVLTIAIVLAGTALAAGRSGIQESSSSYVGTEREAVHRWGRGSVNQDEDGDGLGHICGDEHGEGDCDNGEAHGHHSGQEGRGERRGDGEGRGRSSEEGCQLH